MSAKNAKLRLHTVECDRHNHLEDDCHGITEVHLELREDEKVIGKMLVFRIEAEKIWDDDSSLVNSCDAHSTAVCQYYEVISDYKYEGELRRELDQMFPYQGNYNALIIDLLEIESEFRRRKLGLFAMRKAMRTWGRNCGLVVIRPLPLQYRRDTREEEEKSKSTPEFAGDLQKLVRYYKQLGFKRIGKTEHYALSLEDELPRV